MTGAPERTCVGCRGKAPRELLRRFVLVDGRPAEDPSKSAPGRGAWLHDDPACAELAERRHAMDRALRRAKRE